MENKLPEGEMVGVPRDESLIPDRLSQIKWRTREGEYIRIPDLQDSHLRNIGLFLMGLGYSKCIAPNDMRVLWLTVLRIEWERRLMVKRELERRYGQSDKLVKR